MIKCTKTDCNAYDKDEICLALNDNDFGPRACPFYKSKSDWLKEEIRRMRKDGMPDVCIRSALSISSSKFYKLVNTR